MFYSATATLASATHEFSSEIYSPLIIRGNALALNNAAGLIRWYTSFLKFRWKTVAPPLSSLSLSFSSFFSWGKITESHLVSRRMEWKNDSKVPVLLQVSDPFNWSPFYRVYPAQIIGMNLGLITIAQKELVMRADKDDPCSIILSVRRDVCSLVRIDRLPRFFLSFVRFWTKIRSFANSRYFSCPCRVNEYTGGYTGEDRSMERKRFDMLDETALNSSVQWYFIGLEER